MFFIFSMLVVAVCVIMLSIPAVRENLAGGWLWIIGGTGSLFLLFSILSCFTIVGAGCVGVIDTFGKVSDNTYKSGINMRNPVARIVEMSIKTQEVKEVMDVPSKEGLTVNLEVSLLFHLDPNKANQIYKTVGVNYQEIIVLPQFRSIMRGVTTLYDAKALYTSQRDSVEQLVIRDLRAVLEPRGVYVETAPLRKIALPPALHNAIEAKLTAEQASQQMEFVIAKEKKEADRKAIEAGGIARFQNIVVAGISDKLLQWKGIEATEKLAASSNAKVIIIGGKNGLPVILNPQ